MDIITTMVNDTKYYMTAACAHTVDDHWYLKMTWSPNSNKAVRISQSIMAKILSRRDDIQVEVLDTHYDNPRMEANISDVLEGIHKNMPESIDEYNRTAVVHGETDGKFGYLVNEMAIIPAAKTPLLDEIQSQGRAVRKKEPTRKEKRVMWAAFVKDKESST